MYTKPWVSCADSIRINSTKTWVWAMIHIRGNTCFYTLDLPLFELNTFIHLSIYFTTVQIILPLFKFYWRNVTSFSWKWNCFSQAYFHFYLAAVLGFEFLYAWNVTNVVIAPWNKISDISLIQYLTTAKKFLNTCLCMHFSCTLWNLCESATVFFSFKLNDKVAWADKQFGYLLFDWTVRLPEQTDSTILHLS